MSGFNSYFAGIKGSFVIDNSSPGFKNFIFELDCRRNAVLEKGTKECRL